MFCWGPTNHSKGSIDHGPGLENDVLVSGMMIYSTIYSFFRAKVIWPAGLWKMNFLKKLTKKDSSNSLGQGTKTFSMWSTQYKHIFSEIFVNWRCYKCQKRTWAHSIVWTSVKGRTLQNCKLLLPILLSQTILLQNGWYPQWRWSPRRY